MTCFFNFSNNSTNELMKNWINFSEIVDTLSNNGPITRRNKKNAADKLWNVTQFTPFWKTIATRSFDCQHCIDIKKNLLKKFFQMLLNHGPENENIAIYINFMLMLNLDYEKTCIFIYNLLKKHKLRALPILLRIKMDARFTKIVEWFVQMYLLTNNLYPYGVGKYFCFIRKNIINIVFFLQKKLLILLQKIFLLILYSFLEEIRLYQYF